MKKSLAIAMILCIIFLLSGCKEKAEPTPTAEIDIEYYSKYGKIPECEFTVGQDIDTVLSTLEERVEAQSEDETDASENQDSDMHEHNHDEFFFNHTEFDEYTSIHTGDIEYFYKEENRDKGISCIVTYTTAYGFSNETVSVEIEKALTGFEVERYDTSSGDIFFMPYGEFSCLKYSFEKNDIVFIFADNALCATAIYDNTQWKI